MTGQNKKFVAATPKAASISIGTGGETHQVAGPGQPVLTTNHGMPISDDHNSLRAGPRGGPPPHRRRCA
jgi:catalase